MDKKILIAAGALAVLAVLLISNPNEDAHKEAVKKAWNQSLKESTNASDDDDSEGSLFKGFGSILTSMIGSSVIESLVDQMVTSDSYGIFSLTKVDAGKGPQTVGVGMFGHVFLSEKAKSLSGDMAED